MAPSEFNTIGIRLGGLDWSSRPAQINTSNLLLETGVLTKVRLLYGLLHNNTKRWSGSLAKSAQLAILKKQRRYWMFGRVFYLCISFKVLDSWFKLVTVVHEGKQSHVNYLLGTDCKWYCLFAQPARRHGRYLVKLIGWEFPFISFKSSM